jgi:hypothetical protein
MNRLSRRLWRRSIPRIATPDYALADQPLTVFSDGKPTRSFCYVSDQGDNVDPLPKPSPRRGSSLPRSLFAGRERDSRPETGTPILRPRQRPYRLARASGRGRRPKVGGRGSARTERSVLEALSPLTRRAAPAGLPAALRFAGRGERLTREIVEAVREVRRARRRKSRSQQLQV